MRPTGSRGPPWLLIITWQDIKLTPKSSSAPETPYKQQPLGLRLPPQEIPRLYCPGGGAARLNRYSRHNPATRQLDNRKGVNNNSTHQSKNIQNNYRLKNFLLTANLKKDRKQETRKVGEKINQNGPKGSTSLPYRLRVDNYTM